MIEKLNEILQGLLKNPIVDEYDSGIWHVRKYANGLAELSIFKSVTVAINNLVSSSPPSFYYGIQTEAIPDGFIDVEGIVQIQTNQTTAMSCYNYVSDEQISAGLFRVGGSATVDGVFAAKLTARWK